MARSWELRTTTLDVANTIELLHIMWLRCWHSISMGLRRSCCWLKNAWWRGQLMTAINPLLSKMLKDEKKLRWAQFRLEWLTVFPHGTIHGDISDHSKSLRSWSHPNLFQKVGQSQIFNTAKSRRYGQVRKVNGCQESWYIFLTGNL